MHELSAAGDQLRSGSALPSLSPCIHCDPPTFEDLQKLLDTTKAHVIHHHGLDSRTALEVEGALIDAYFGLINQPNGHLTLQSHLVYINTLMIRRVLAGDGWSDRMMPRDLGALSPLMTQHINAYGRFELDLDARLELETQIRLSSGKNGGWC